MHHDNLGQMIRAIDMALGEEVSAKDFRGRFMIQKGCYILAQWGDEPKYVHPLYIRGPYSDDLADDYDEMLRTHAEIPPETDIPAEHIAKLSEILRSGVKYTEAYSTVLMTRLINPYSDWETIKRISNRIKPNLNSEIEDACQKLIAES